MHKFSATTIILWAVFLSLLAVLLPHTAWLFGQFEPVNKLGTASAWAGAFAFEAAIAVLTHKLAKHIEAGPKRFSPGRRFAYRYLNAYAVGLMLSVCVSSLANLGHAVEFGRSLVIFAAWGVSPVIYQVAFGAVLPLVSLLFARVLSNVSESEEAISPELEATNKALAEVRAQLRQSEGQRREAEERARQAEDRFNAVGDFFARIAAPEKRQRIIAVREKWPGLPNAAVAIITETSQGYVSDVLKEIEVEQ